MAGTRVKVSGFEMRFSEGIHMNNFFQALESISRSSDIKVGNYNTRLYTRIINNLAVGLILTFKDDKIKLATEKDGTGKLKVNRVELLDNQTSTEASLFCFNPSTGSGIFTHYTGAASVSIYTSIFNQAHKNVKDSLVNQKVNEWTNWGEKGDRSKARNRAQDLYAGSFSFKYIYQQKDLDQILGNMKSLSEVEVTTELGIPDEPIFRHLGAAAKKTTQTVKFLDQFKKIDNLKGHLSNFIEDVFSSKSKRQSLKLIGLSLNGTRIQYWLGDNIEEYGFFEYDNYIDDLPEDIWDNYVSCSALASLIDIVEKDENTFGGIRDTNYWNKHMSVTDLTNEPEISNNHTSLKTIDDFKEENYDPLQIEMCL